MKKRYKDCDCFPITCIGKHNKQGRRNILNCPRCKGTGRLCYSTNYMTCPECKGKGYIKSKSKWDKEFEDRAYLDIEFGDLCLNEYERFRKVCKKYLSINCLKPKLNEMTKVKIRCKDGCIQIERIR